MKSEKEMDREAKRLVRNNICGDKTSDNPCQVYQLNTMVEEAFKTKEKEDDIRSCLTMAKDMWDGLTELTDEEKEVNTGGKLFTNYDMNKLACFWVRNHA